MLDIVWGEIPLDRSRDREDLHHEDCTRWQAALKHKQPLHNPYPRPTRACVRSAFCAMPQRKKGRRLPSDRDLLALIKTVSVDEIAEHYGVSPGTVTSMVSRAKRR